MDKRIPRSRPDFSKRSKRESTIMLGATNVSHYVQNISRNEDVFNFIAAISGEVSSVHIVLSSIDKSALSGFVLKMFVYKEDNSSYINKFPVDKIGLTSFVFESIPILLGERVRFDIESIDSVYEHITGLGIAFMLQAKAG